MPKNIVLELSDFQVFIDEKKIINIKNLTLFENSNLGIYCPTGSGKTTLLNIISNCNLPSNIKVAGTKKIEKNTILSYAFQTPVLLENQSVTKNLFLSINKKISKEEKYKICEKYIKAFDLSLLKDKRVKLLSGGERQRVNIARSFVNAPSLLLLDEPFSSQDDKQIKNIIKIINEYKEKSKCCVIIVSHSKKELEVLCDSIMTNLL